MSERFARRACSLLLTSCLALLCWGCQSIASFGAVCQSDEDCESYQTCDDLLRACVLADGYNVQTCDPESAFDRCPTGTSCDTEAQRCLPRKLRIAWVFAFDSSIYQRRQIANLITFITQHIASNYFEPLTCDAPEGLSHVTTRCSNAHVEFLFIDNGDDVNIYKQRIQEAYQDYPFDLALTYFSSGYAFSQEVQDENQLGYFTLGRVNRRYDKVKFELEEGYDYPSVDTRFDISLQDLARSYELADFMANKLFCERPLMVYLDNEPYRLDRELYERSWANLGMCMSYTTIPTMLESSYPDFVKELKEVDHDCLYIHATGEELPNLMRDYVREILPGRDTPPTWIITKSRLNSGNENALAARSLIEAHFADSTYATSSRNENPNYESLVGGLERAYRTFLLEKQCLGEPRVSCAQLDCTNTQDVLSLQACEALSCVTQAPLKSCLELGCFRNDAPEYCARLECPLIQSDCAYYEPTFLRNGEDSVSLITDLSIIAHLMVEQYKHFPKESLPLSPELFRDMFMAMTDAPACGFPNLSKCKTLIEQSEDDIARIGYDGLYAPLKLGQDGRLAQSSSTAIYEKFKGGTFTEPIAYSPVRQRELEEKFTIPLVMCESPDSN